MLISILIRLLVSFSPALAILPVWNGSRLDLSLPSTGILSDALETKLLSVLGKQRQNFEQFRSKFKKAYKTGNEMAQRAEIFKKNCDFIESIKEKAMNNGWKAGVTIFSDMTDDEKGLFVMEPGFVEDANLNPVLINSNVTPPGRSKRDAQRYPGQISDWRSVSAMPPVRDQGLCGGCFAFAVVNAIEVQYNWKNGVSGNWLSEQQIIDCSLSYGNQGCNGGYLDKALQFGYYVGQPYRSTYPYTQIQGQCQNKGNYRFIDGWSKLTGVTQMEYELTRNGPLAFLIWVPQEIYSYAGGIFYPDQTMCSRASNLGGHAMSIVGHGSENGIPYWIIRNSWGPNWGEGGYFRMRKGVDNCGMESLAVYIPRVVVG